MVLKPGIIKNNNKVLKAGVGIKDWRQIHRQMGI